MRSTAAVVTTALPTIKPDMSIKGLQVQIEQLESKEPLKSLELSKQLCDRIHEVIYPQGKKPAFEATYTEYQAAVNRYTSKLRETAKLMVVEGGDLPSDLKALKKIFQDEISRILKNLHTNHTSPPASSFSLDGRSEEVLACLFAGYLNKKYQTGCRIWNATFEHFFDESHLIVLLAHQDFKGINPKQNEILIELRRLEAQKAGEPSTTSDDVEFDGPCGAQHPSRRQNA